MYKIPIIVTIELSAVAVCISILLALAVRIISSPSPQILSLATISSFPYTCLGFHFGTEATSEEEIYNILAFLQ